MIKEKLIKTFKIFIIVLLVIAISLLAILQWKSDIIIDKVMTSVQHQLVDSLRYADAGMDWFAHFPSISVHITDLNLGSGKKPLIDGGDVDIVLGFFPLFKNKLVVNELLVVNSTLHITQLEGRWSYEIYKKTDSTSQESFSGQINQLVLENTILHYNDGKSMSFELDITDAKIKGSFDDKKLDTELDLHGTLNHLVLDDLKPVDPFAFSMNGHYTFDLNSGLQDFKEWQIQNENILLTGGGTILRETDHEVVDVKLGWEKGKTEILKTWLPEKMIASWSDYTLSGESKGQVTITGKSSKKETPHIKCNAELKNGGIDFKKEGQSIKGLNVDLAYDSGKKQTNQKSRLDIVINKSSMMGPSLKGKVSVENLEHPLMDITLNGSLPAGLLNLMSVPSLHFEEGSFEIEEFELDDLQLENSTLTTFLEKTKASFTARNLHFIYLNNKMELPDGAFKLNNKKLDVEVDQIKWNKVNVTDLKGGFVAKEAQLEFTLEGVLSEGKIETQGIFSGIDQRPLCTAKWKVKSIDMKDLLASFSNFDQTFITSDHLSGKADIWAETIIPFDEKWNIITHSIVVKSAIDIREGQLKGMKTLEDFSKYVHLDDLRDIRFNQLRNYMKIENGKVFLPVMFIQSSANNLSITGTHGFDQTIVYYIKLNAGQAATNKLKKIDVKKDFKQARKSGWINMYFVLEGNTDNVKYQQYREAVISGFEQSAALKESLRNELVEKFGYEVYWLEPNEWEDIPEYQ